MDPLVKQMLNSLKCPVCKGQVDLMDYGNQTRNKKFNYCCVNNWEHYRLFFVHWEPVLRIEYEMVVLYEGRHQYSIWQFENNSTSIFISEVDAENRVLENVDATQFVYNKKLFDFSQTNREKLINRAKTILVFQ